MASHDTSLFHKVLLYLGSFTSVSPAGRGHGWAEMIHLHDPGTAQCLPHMRCPGDASWNNSLMNGRVSRARCKVQVGGVEGTGAYFVLVKASS